MNGLTGETTEPISLKFCTAILASLLTVIGCDHFKNLTNSETLFFGRIFLELGGNTNNEKSVTTFSKI